jgi:hypothetical protein
MELESLKYIWRSLEIPPAPGPDRQALLALLQKKSRGYVARMQRNLLGEAILLLVAYIPGILCYVVEFEGRLSAISWLFVLLALLFEGYYYRKYRLLKKMQCVSCEVRSNLARQVNTLKKYTRFYLLVGTALIPVSFLISFVIIRWKLPLVVGAFGGGGPWWANPIFWFIGMAPLTIGIYYVNAWYVNKLYGRHIKKLQELLREMEEE